jgi:putative ABC transport system permease protein
MDLGFDKENLISLPQIYYKGGTEAFKNELEKDKDITGVTIALWDVGTSYGGSSSMSNPSDSTSSWDFSFLDVDFDFLKTINGRLVAGRFFSNSFGSDITDVDSVVSAQKGKLKPEEWMNIMSGRPIVITYQTAKALKIMEPIVGTVLKYGALQGTVIGVIRDLQGVSLLKKPSMTIIRGVPENNWGNAFIRISPRNVSSTIGYIEKVWGQFFPGREIRFSFVDQKLQQLYTSQQRLASVFNIFATLSIVIALLGLFSIVSISAGQRQKEISIRKVIGAGTAHIFILLSKEFTNLILLSFCIGAPIAWYCMNKWLEDFQYRASISWWIYPALGVILIVSSNLILSLFMLKAILSKPVDSIRTE